MQNVLQWVLLRVLQGVLQGVWQGVWLCVLQDGCVALSVAVGV